MFFSVATLHFHTLFYCPAFGKSLRHRQIPLFRVSARRLIHSRTRADEGQQRAALEAKAKAFFPEWAEKTKVAGAGQDRQEAAQGTMDVYIQYIYIYIYIYIYV